MEWIAYAIIEIAGIYSAYRAVMETRTAQGATAWLVFLTAFPLLGLPAYWILGRNRFVGYKNARQIKQGFVRQSLARLHEQLAPYHLPDEGPAVIDVVKTGIATLPPLRGNDVQLLINGQATFADMLAGIERAEHYVLFQFFIVKNDKLGNRFKSALCDKARQGVQVYFLYDEIGSHQLDTTWLAEMRSAGVQVSAFNTTRGRGNRLQINFRNHRKLVLTDGRHAWIGGHNIGDEYLDGGERFECWRDTHVRISGPAVLAAQLAFVEDWYWATEQLLETLCWEATAEPADLPVLILPTGPADRLETAGLAFADFISRAKRRLWIASPYFVPDDATLAALQLAALRGVDVRILIPDRPDHRIVYLAAFAYFPEASRAGVRFYRYTKGFMHQKVILVDSELAAIGTANFDNRSFRLNFENTAIVFDHAFAERVAAMLREDFRHARAMSAADSEQRPLWFRFAAKLARLAAPVL